jgi:hypothetical protein
MNRFFTLLFCLFLFASHAQSGYQIRIKFENIQSDSIFINKYNVKNKKFTAFLSLKFENDITIKDKTPLEAGIYTIEADSMILSEFLISDAKNQKFTISILEKDITAEGSKENSANREYMKQMFEFEFQGRVLENDFKQMQRSGVSNEMMQIYVDTLTKKLDNLFAEKRAMQEKIIAENKGTLLASIIQCSLDAPPPPKEFLRDRVKFYSFMSEHLFNQFPWEDERLLNTPVLYNKFKTFAQQIFHLETEFSIPIVLKVLNESKRNRNIYYALFDYLEHEFGNYKSPYRDELLYIAMLKNILQTTDLEEPRQLRYEYELKLLDKNHEGEQAPNFNILLSNGDTTNLYAFEAELLMLYFQNPDCPTCGELRDKMKNMEIVNNAIASGKLKIVTVYFEENEELWRNYLNTRAFTNWIHGWNYDFQIPKEQLYDIRVIPMIMFLDKDKKILKKDLLSNEIEEWLKRYL